MFKELQCLSNWIPKELTQKRENNNENIEKCLTIVQNKSHYKVRIITLPGRKVVVELEVISTNELISLNAF